MKLVSQVHVVSKVVDEYLQVALKRANTQPQATAAKRMSEGEEVICLGKNKVCHICHHRKEM